MSIETCVTCRNVLGTNRNCIRCQVYNPSLCQSQTSPEPQQPAPESTASHSVPHVDVAGDTWKRSLATLLDSLTVLVNTATEEIKKGRKIR